MLALIGLAALGATYIVLTGWNPLPQTMDWLAKVGTLASPAPSWKVRADEQPTAAAITGGAVVLLAPGTVQARDRGTGDVLWTRDAAWGAIAGDPDAGTVVAVIGRPSRHGYDVVDAPTGSPRWSDPDASAVWTYRDLVLDLRCPQPAACTLTAREPRDGTVRWRSALPSLGHGLTGGNPRLAAPRPLSRAPVDGTAVAPVAAPSVIGLPVDGGVQTVSLAGGRRLASYPTGPKNRVVVAGGRVLSVTGVRRGNACRYTVSARDPSSGSQLWRLDGYDLDTADAIGCEQQKDPVAGAGLLLGSNPAGMDVLIDPTTGTIRVTAGADERIVATDGALALLRTADKHAIRAIGLGGGTGGSGGGGGQLWRASANRQAAVSIGGYGIMLSDPGVSELRVLDPLNGHVTLAATTGATVLGATSSTLILGLGRTVGLLPH